MEMDARFYQDTVAFYAMIVIRFGLSTANLL